MNRKKRRASSAKKTDVFRARDTVADMSTMDKTGGISCGRKEDRTLAADACGAFMSNPFIPAASGCAPSACASCAAKSPAGACCPSQSGDADLAANDLAAGNEEISLPAPTQEERAAILALDYASVSQALRADDPVTVAVTTEFIVHYSLKVAQVLREGNEFLHVVTHEESTPAVERIAMGIVREAVSESLAMEASGLSA